MLPQVSEAWSAVELSRMSIDLLPQAELCKLPDAR
jgi:hypothetical protein